MITQIDEIPNETQRRIKFIDSLYLYSDFPVELIAKTVKMNVKEVQQIIDNLTRKDALEALYEQANIPAEQIMKKDVAILDYSKTALDAVDLMIKKGTGCIVITSQGRPFGMVTERDILCETTVFNKLLAQLSLKVIASRPLLYVSPTETVGNIADLMMNNNIRRVPVVNDDNLVGIVVAKDIAMLLSSKRPSLAKIVLDAMSRSRKT